MASTERDDWTMRVAWTFGLVAGVRYALFDLERGQAIWNDLYGYLQLILIVGFVLLVADWKRRSLKQKEQSNGKH